MRLMAADIDPISTSLDPDRIYALKLAREDLYSFRYMSTLSPPNYAVELITKRAEEYLTWLQS